MHNDERFRRIDRNLQWIAAPVKVRAAGLLIVLGMTAGFAVLGILAFLAGTLNSLFSGGQ